MIDLLKIDDTLILPNVPYVYDMYDTHVIHVLWF